MEHYLFDMSKVNREPKDETERAQLHLVQLLVNMTTNVADTIGPKRTREILNEIMTEDPRFFQRKWRYELNSDETKVI